MQRTTNSLGRTVYLKLSKGKAPEPDPVVKEDDKGKDKKDEKKGDTKKPGSAEDSGD